VARACPLGRRVAFTAVSGSGLATGLAVTAGLAGSVQVAMMSRLGERIGVLEALAFSTATSSAKLNSSVGDLVFKSCSFISCMRCYSKRE